MPSITITNGAFSQAGAIVDALSSATGMKVFTDREIITLTAQREGLKEASLLKILKGQTPTFNTFTKEREKSLAAVKLTLAELLAEGDIILHGLSGHLVPASLTPVLRTLIITDKKRRIENARETRNITDKEATARIQALDEAAQLWCSALHGKSAWDPELYDVVIPTDKTPVPEALSLITESLSRIEVDPEEEARLAADFSLAARVEQVLVDTGEGLTAEARDGHVTVTINKNVLMLGKFKQKVEADAARINGVTSVETRIGKGFYKANVMYDFDLPTPPRVLLVDDEKEFVQTLSERLRMREMTTSVAYGGEEALAMAGKEETDVMVLDLKMPGVNGYDVLKNMKANRPHVEVIILTGHGSEEDRKRCLAMGAFAYLQKPADIERLTETMKAAYDKIRASRAEKAPAKA
ncbi:response regulator [Desulfoluna butyratoxydans]|uniref:Signal transduction response regulator receiver domain n=1 Tax=Desulfoluna butyratoxydans TaxID=231438 RepID=A0A4U8YJC5_9BACT|nr:response regulator [Desulfoluna butyratoxydans]VFQ43414.1 signal transduction response regulator receiver domain [Desulfoluna butyratoxydans]